MANMAKESPGASRVPSCSSGQSDLADLVGDCFVTAFLAMTKKGPERVGSTHLAENSVAYLRNVLCRPDSCRSLMREHRLVAWPARGITGHDQSFPESCRTAGVPQKRILTVRFTRNRVSCDNLVKAIVTWLNPPALPGDTYFSGYEHGVAFWGTMPKAGVYLFGAFTLTISAPSIGMLSRVCPRR